MIKSTIGNSSRTFGLSGNEAEGRVTVHTHDFILFYLQVLVDNIAQQAFPVGVSVLKEIVWL